MNSVHRTPLWFKMSTLLILTEAMSEFIDIKRLYPQTSVNGKSRTFAEEEKTRRSVGPRRQHWTPLWFKMRNPVRGVVLLEAPVSHIPTLTSLIKNFNHNTQPLKSLVCSQQSGKCWRETFELFLLSNISKAISVNTSLSDFDWSHVRVYRHQKAVSINISKWKEQNFINICRRRKKHLSTLGLGFQIKEARVDHG